MQTIPENIANCRILGRLGSGGMGSVYRAVHTNLGRTLALKILPADLASNPEFVLRFLREGRSVAKLTHPNVVTVYDAGEQDGVYYLSMELVEGASLGEMLERGGPFPEAAALNLMEQAAKGLQAAHNSGLVHRDLKPDNLLVNAEGVLKVVDFGLVFDQSAETHLTRQGSYLGTPAFMSPEQCQSLGTDVRSDLYSLGATFYCMVAGVPPFHAKSTMVLLRKHLEEEAPDPRKFQPFLSDGTSALLLKCLQKKPENRFQSADEVLKAVEVLRPQLKPASTDWELKPIVQKCLDAQKKRMEEEALARAKAQETAVLDATTVVRKGPPPSETQPVQRLGPGVTPLPQSDEFRAAAAPAGPPSRLWIVAAVVIALLMASAAVGVLYFRQSQVQDALAEYDAAADDPYKALAALRTLEMRYPDNSEVLSRRQALLDYVLGRLRAVVENPQPEMDAINRADQLANAAQMEFYTDTELQSLQGRLRGARAAALRRSSRGSFGEAIARMKEHIDAARMDEAIGEFQTAQRLKPDGQALALDAARRQLAAALVAAAREAMGKNDYGKALGLASRAHEFGGPIGFSDEVRTQRELAALKSDAASAQKQNLPLDAAVSLYKASQLIGGADGTAYSNEAKALRSAHFQRQADEAHAQKHWTDELVALNEALKMQPDRAAELNPRQAAVEKLLREASPGEELLVAARTELDAGEYAEARANLNVYLAGKSGGEGVDLRTVADAGLKLRSGDWRLRTNNPNAALTSFKEAQALGKQVPKFVERYPRLNKDIEADLAKTAKELDLIEKLRKTLEDARKQGNRSEALKALDGLTEHDFAEAPQYRALRKTVREELEFAKLAAQARDFCAAQKWDEAVVALRRALELDFATEGKDALRQQLKECEAHLAPDAH